MAKNLALNMQNTVAPPPLWSFTYSQHQFTWVRDINLTLPHGYILKIIVYVYVRMYEAATASQTQYTTHLREVNSIL